MTLDEINRLRALKAKDDGIAFDLAVLQVADRLLDAAERLEQAERDHAAVLDYKLAEAGKELTAVVERLYRAEKERDAQAEAVRVLGHEVRECFVVFARMNKDEMMKHLHPKTDANPIARAAVEGER